ncbi:ABC transporter substrate-binding protein [Actinomyces gerencseriae]|uniref:ABC transporter substrate-binding protein n=1 Tax=Actinomyces gerencseriae TaxID=52769 RepID=UPI0003FBA788|nr:ABC transporter substrate-binding protein [Actinomyces gerencseriae]
MVRLPTHAFRALALTAVLALAGTGVTACVNARNPGQDLGSCEVLARYTPKDETDGTVKIATALTGTEGERFEQSLTRFEECTGVDVVHEGTDRLEENLRGRAEGTTDWDADLAIVPQPGLVADLAGEGALSPLSDVVGANVELGWDHTWSAAGTVDGTFYGAPLMASVKSFVWYSPQAFSKAGYEIPTTWDDVVALTDRIAADHPKGDVTPWCLGMADGGTTGWSMTDWLEETLLATSGISAYDAWAGHDVALDSPSAVNALGSVDSLLMRGGHVSGGRQGALSTTMEQAGQRLVDGSCLMMLASSSFETMLPAGTTITDPKGRGEGGASDSPTAGGGATGGGTTTGGEPVENDSAAGDTATGGGTTTSAGPATSVSAFIFPGAADEDGNPPVLVGGDYLVSLNRVNGTSAAANAVMEYLTSAEWAQQRAELGGVATANRGVDVSEVSSDVTVRATRILQSRQSVIRLDASDSMPSQVGTDALWTALTSWTAGDLDAKKALAQAEAAWPSQ